MHVLFLFFSLLSSFSLSLDFCIFDKFVLPKNTFLTAFIYKKYKNL